MNVSHLVRPNCVLLTLFLKFVCFHKLDANHFKHLIAKPLCGVGFREHRHHVSCVLFAQGFPESGGAEFHLCADGHRRQAEVWFLPTHPRLPRLHMSAQVTHTQPLNGV